MIWGIIIVNLIILAVLFSAVQTVNTDQKPLVKALRDENDAQKALLATDAEIIATQQILIEELRKDD